MRLRKILYIGNKLNRHGFTPTTVETLPPMFGDGVQFTTISDRLNPLLRLIHIWGTLIRTAKQYDFVLIDTYSTRNFHFAWTSGWLCRKLHVPYFPFLHGGMFYKRMKNTPKLVNSYLQNASRILVPSKYLQRLIEKAGFSCTYLPNSINYESYPFTSRHKPGATLLWVRSLSAIYNPIMALKVLQMLIPHVPGVFLHLVGPQKDISLLKLKQFISKNQLQWHVKLWGYLSKPEWINLSERCDIFLNTSRFDNMPVTLIEAMAMGLPVVTTNAGGIADMFTHRKHALLVPVDDTVSMAREVRRLLKDDALRLRLSHEAHLYAAKFAWNKIQQDWRYVLELDT